MVVSFDYEVHVLSALTSDRKILERAIKDARIGEQLGTALRDAVAEVIERRFKRVNGRKAIILLTDGKDFGSRINPEDLFDEAAEAGAMIYPIFFETGFPGRGRNAPRFPFPGRRRPIGDWWKRNKRDASSRFRRSLEVPRRKRGPQSAGRTYGRCRYRRSESREDLNGLPSGPHRAC